MIKEIIKFLKIAAIVGVFTFFIYLLIFSKYNPWIIAPVAVSVFIYLVIGIANVTTYGSWTEDPWDN